MGGNEGRPRWVAIVTGAISIAIAVIYLLLITVLDARGPMLPPPPEALGVEEGSLSRSAAVVPPPDASLSREIA